MFSRIKPIIFGCLIFVSISCNHQEDAEPVLSIEQLIEKEIEKKLNNYRKVRHKKCRSNLFETAGRRADSIIIARAKELKVIQDSINRPDAPIRPERPDLLEPIDSTFPIPLLDEDSLFSDTIFNDSN